MQENGHVHGKAPVLCATIRQNRPKAQGIARGFAINAIKTLYLRIPLFMFPSHS
jgi:hypothetical protein